MPPKGKKRNVSLAGTTRTGMPTRSQNSLDSGNTEDTKSKSLPNFDESDNMPESPIQIKDEEDSEASASEAHGGPSSSSSQARDLANRTSEIIEDNIEKRYPDLSSSYQENAPRDSEEESETVTGGFEVSTQSVEKLPEKSLSQNSTQELQVEDQSAKNLLEVSLAQNPTQELQVDTQSSDILLEITLLQNQALEIQHENSDEQSESHSEAGYGSSSFNISKTSEKEYGESHSSKEYRKTETISKPKQTVYVDDEQVSDNRPGRRSEGQNTGEIGDWYPCLFYGFIVMIAIAAVFWPTILKDLQKMFGEQDHVLSPVETFTNEFRQLKGEHPDQHKKIWRIIGSTMKNHMNEVNPRQPAVVMLVSTKKAAATRENLAMKIAEIYSVRCNNINPVWVSGENYEGMKHGTAKEQIDDKITTAFHDNSCAAVISNFQLLPPASTTTFYQFCENDQAPFKNVSVIFTLEINHGAWDEFHQYSVLRDQSVPDPKYWDVIVDSFLYYSLQRRDETGLMRKDMISGLMSRITPSVAWITQESKGRGK